METLDFCVWRVGAMILYIQTSRYFYTRRLTFFEKHKENLRVQGRNHDCQFQELGVHIRLHLLLPLSLDFDHLHTNLPTSSPL